MCIVDELSDAIVAVVALELGPEEDISMVTVALDGELTDVTLTVTGAVEVVVETAEEISGPSDDGV
jgi:hypothetical protein